MTVRASEPAAKATLPALEAAGSFLLKNETKFIRVYEPGSNEEFNQIVNQRDSHMTLCVNWSATINDNGASRKAYGQHFVQLRKISNKKGVSRSLLSATKRWFVTNKPGVNTNQNAVVYTNEST